MAFKMKYTNGKKADITAFPFKGGVAQDSPLDFNWKAAAGGAMQGGATGSMFGPWGTAIGAVGGGLMAGFSGEEEEEEAAVASGPVDPAASNRPGNIKDKVRKRVNKKVNEEVDKKVDEVVNQTAGDGLNV